jgi:NAD-dependent SIR2 family protein deacetylase
MAYASGKFAKAICDRCGFEYKLLELKKEWNGLKTCPECYEPKHPQLEPTPTVADAQALYEPRPNNDKEVGFGYVLTNNDKILGNSIEGFKMTSSLGEVTITV